MSPKCSVVTRPYVPGQHGPTMKMKLSEYGKQLREKQKVKKIYNLSENTLLGYYSKSEKKIGDTRENLILALETRIDNVIFRAGFVQSRSSARQMVSHGKFRLNGRKVTIPSIALKSGDVIEFSDKDKINEKRLPKWLSAEKNKLQFKRTPERSEIDFVADENLVVEFYSR